MARIFVAVGASVAAWKACDLVSQLVQGGHEVDVALTERALWFVRPLSFSALTQRRVHVDEEWGKGDAPAEHLGATRDAQLLVVAPCTADLIGKFAHGIADDLVTTTFLGATCPRLLAPAMNARMWQNRRVVANVDVLRGDGVRFVGPAKGWLAEGEQGEGRMAEPAEIVAEIGKALASTGRR